MTIPAEWMPCLQTLGLLSVEMTLLVGVAACLQRRTASVSWHRAIWQAATVGAALLCLVEVSGFSLSLRERMRTWFPAAASFDESPSAVQPAAPESFGAPRLTPAFRTEVAARLAARRSHLHPGPEPDGRIGRSVPDDSWVDEPWLQGHSLPWPELVWFFGSAAALAAVIFGRVLFLFFFVAHLRTVADSALLARVAVIAERMGFRGRVSVLESPRLTGPIAFGALRPTVGLPQNFAKRFSPAQQEAVLAHELAHLAGRDPVWQWLVDLTTALLWWHPLMWWTRHQLRAAAESVADEASLVVTRGPEMLAECLVQLASMVAQRQPLGWIGATGPGFRSGLGRRVERLVRLRGRWSPLNRKHTRALRAFVPAAFVAAAMISTAWVGPKTNANSMNTITQTWKRSFVAMGLFAAAAVSPEQAVADAPPPTVAVAPAVAPESAAVTPSRAETLVSDARLLAETGKIQEAREKLQEALRRNPANQEAARYLTALEAAQLKGPTRLGRGPGAGGTKADEALRVRYGLQPSSNPVPTPSPAGPPPEPEPEPPVAEEPASSSPGFHMDQKLLERYGIRPPANRGASGAAGPARASRGKQQIEAKLNQIVLPDVTYEGLPLFEIVKDLKNEARLRDPAKQGLNFLISNVPESGAAFGGIDPTTGIPVNQALRIDPATGIPIPSTVGDVASLIIHLQLHDVRLRDVLDAMTRIAEQPLRYSIEEYGVVFSPGAGPAFAPASPLPNQPIRLQVRTFRVETNTFLAGLENAFGISLPAKADPAEVRALEERLQKAEEELAQKPAGRGESREALVQQQKYLQNEIQMRRSSRPGEDGGEARPDRARQVQRAVRQLLVQLGVDMDAPNKAVFYNDLTGILMVRATAEDLELVQAAIETLGGRALAPNSRAALQDVAPAGNGVSVLGQVNRPGLVMLPLDQKVDLLEGIARAAGFAPTANRNKILLSRDGSSTLYRFDDLKRLKQVEDKVWLQAGDIIEVEQSLF